jgi:hypothetical protein
LSGKNVDLSRDISEKTWFIGSDSKARKKNEASLNKTIKKEK